MKKKCTNCGKEFGAKRADAKFCSAKCRKAYSRDVTDNLSVTIKRDNVTDKADNYVTDNNLSVTDNETYVTSEPDTKPETFTTIPVKNISAELPKQPTDETAKRDWLISCFELEGRTPEEIEYFMQHQDNYFQQFGQYFIPARFNQQAA